MQNQRIICTQALLAKLDAEVENTQDVQPTEAKRERRRRAGPFQLNILLRCLLKNASSS